MMDSLRCQRYDLGSGLIYSVDLNDHGPVVLHASDQGSVVVSMNGETQRVSVSDPERCVLRVVGDRVVIYSSAHDFVATNLLWLEPGKEPIAFSVGDGVECFTPTETGVFVGYGEEHAEAWESLLRLFRWDGSSDFEYLKACSDGSPGMFLDPELSPFGPGHVVFSGSVHLQRESADVVIVVNVMDLSLTRHTTPFSVMEVKLLGWVGSDTLLFYDMRDDPIGGRPFLWRVGEREVQPCLVGLPSWRSAQAGTLFPSAKGIVQWDWQKRHVYLWTT